MNQISPCILPRLLLTATFIAMLVITSISCHARRSLATAPVVQLDPNLARYSGPDVEITISTRASGVFTGRSDWLMIDAAATGQFRAVSRMSREAITLITPDGKIFPLASQRVLAKDYGALEGLIRRSSLARTPLEVYAGDREICPLSFLVEPGRGTVTDTLLVNDRQYCIGRFYFYLGETVQPGEYIVQIRTPKGSGRVPFILDPPKR